MVPAAQPRIDRAARPFGGPGSQRPYTRLPDRPGRAGARERSNPSRRRRAFPQARTSIPHGRAWHAGQVVAARAAGRVEPVHDSAAAEELWRFMRGARIRFRPRVDEPGCLRFCSPSPLPTLAGILALAAGGCVHLDAPRGYDDSGGGLVQMRGPSSCRGENGRWMRRGVTQNRIQCDRVGSRHLARVPRPLRLRR